METQTEYIGGNYLVNQFGGGGFRFPPITTLKGGSETGGSGSVAEYLLGGDTFAIPSYAYSGGKITNESVYNNNNGEERTFIFFKLKQQQRFIKQLIYN